MSESHAPGQAQRRLRDRVAFISWTAASATLVLGFIGLMGVGLALILLGLVLALGAVLVTRRPPTVTTILTGLGLALLEVAFLNPLRRSAVLLVFGRCSSS